LGECGIDDLAPGITKRHRLFAALRTKQLADRCANNVLHFLSHAMSPVRHVRNREHFESERIKINRVLAFNGLSFGDDGQLRPVEAARTIDEAEARATTLRKALIDRRVHVDVLRFCRAELLTDDHFHAVFEATKSVAEKLRVKSGCGTDGAQLVDDALAIARLGHPRLAFNALSNDSERSEQTGLMNLIKGVFGAFRNTTAHVPRIHWHISEQDALDVLTTLSLIHRRLDAAVRTHVP
jgi:uncharacterized protein (TIGR02391 family)